MSGKGHPLPRSDEARHGEIPEHLEREKGCGDDARTAVQPAGEAVTPEGESYRTYTVAGAPHIPDRAAPDAAGAEDDPARDQAEHQDRGQSAADEEAGGD